MPESLEHLFDVWFAAVDVDAGGTISATELLDALGASGMPSERQVLCRLLRTMDTDNSGARDAFCCTHDTAFALTPCALHAARTKGQAQAKYNPDQTKCEACMRRSLLELRLHQRCARLQAVPC